MVKAQPIHGDTDLTNPAQCEGRIVVMKRGRSRFVEKALRAQAAGALALVVINHSDDGDRAKPVALDNSSILLTAGAESPTEMPLLRRSSEVDVGPRRSRFQWWA